MSASRARTGTAVVPLTYWLLVVAGLAMLVLRRSSLAEVVPVCLGSVFGTALGQIFARLRLRMWLGAAIFIGAVWLGAILCSLHFPVWELPGRFYETGMLSFAPATLCGYRTRGARGVLVPGDALDADPARRLGLRGRLSRGGLGASESPLRASPGVLPRPRDAPHGHLEGARERAARGREGSNGPAERTFGRAALARVGFGAGPRDAPAHGSPRTCGTRIVSRAARRGRTRPRAGRRSPRRGATRVCAVRWHRTRARTPSAWRSISLSPARSTWGGR
jgi:hypothetical protein